MDVTVPLHGADDLRLAACVEWNTRIGRPVTWDSSHHEKMQLGPLLRVPILSSMARKGQSTCLSHGFAVTCDERTEKQAMSNRPWGILFALAALLASAGNTPADEPSQRTRLLPDRQTRSAAPDTGQRFDTSRAAFTAGLQPDQSVRTRSSAPTTPITRDRGAETRSQGAADAAPRLDPRTRTSTASPVGLDQRTRFQHSRQP